MSASDVHITAGFLMYRVELKTQSPLWASSKIKYVPNVPCGVENVEGWLGKIISSTVPNVPCGVEKLFEKQKRRESKMFLMYRVELKICLLSSLRLFALCS